VSIHQRKFKAARHHPDDRVRFAVEHDGAAEDLAIAMVAVHPQGITYDGERLMSVLFLLGKDAAEHRRSAESWENSGRQPGGVDLLRDCATRKLVSRDEIAAEGRKGAACVRIHANLARGYGSVGSGVRAASQVISQ